MSVKVPNGSQFAIATTYAASKSMTALSNATEAVGTLEASHGIIVGDVFEVTSGWGNLDKRIVRAGAVSTNDVTFEDINTSSTSLYPAGSGTGSVREISAWTSITQVMTISTSGGDQQFATYQFVDGDTQRQVPTSRTPISVPFTLGDDPTLAGYLAILAASESRAVTAMRIVLPSSGGTIYLNGIFTLNPMPSLTPDQVMTVSGTFSLQGPVTRY